MKPFPKWFTSTLLRTHLKAGETQRPNEIENEIDESFRCTDHFVSDFSVRLNVTIHYSFLSLFAATEVNGTMNTSLVIICVIFSLTSSALAAQQSSSSNVVHEPRFDARVSALISRDILQLAQDIGTTVLKKSTEKAMAFSPLSIFGVLSILLMGSNGQTYNELMQLLKFNDGV